MSNELELTLEEKQHVLADNLILAVKSARERLGIDLKTAKDFVEFEARKIGWLS